MSESWRPLIDALLQRNLVKRRAMENALRRHRPTTETVEKVLLDAKLVTKKQLVEVKGALHGGQTVDLDDTGVDEGAARLLPQAMADRHSVVCYGREGDRLLLAAVQPLDAIALDYLRMRSGFDVSVRLAYAGDVTEAIRKVYAGMPAAPRPVPSSVPPAPTRNRLPVAALNRLSAINEVATAIGERRRVAMPGFQRSAPSVPPPVFTRPSAGVALTPRTVSEKCALCDNTRMLVSTRDERSKLDAILMQVMESTASEGASLLVIEDDGASLFFKHAVGTGAASIVDMVVPLDEASVAGWVLESGECTIVHDAVSDPFHNKETDKMLAFATRSLIAAPVMFGGDALGVVETVNRRRGRYGDDDLLRLQVAAAQIAVVLHEARAARAARDAMMEAVDALVDLLDAHGTVSRAHCMNVAQVSVAIGRESGLEEHELEHLSYAGLLHDIGLSQTLSGDQREHAGRGADFLDRYPLLRHLAPYVGFHHERWDGDGRYGLEGERIPLGARILAIAEAWCEEAPCSDGPALRKHEREFMLRFGTAFDPALQDAFARALDTGRTRRVE